MEDGFQRFLIPTTPVRNSCEYEGRCISLASCVVSMFCAVGTNGSYSVRAARTQGVVFGVVLGKSNQRLFAKGEGS
jgi:hypothetical protein